MRCITKVNMPLVFRLGVCSRILADKNAPVGLETLAALAGEDVGTLENVYEPYLLKEGYIEKTPRGRIITEKGLREL